MYPDDVKFCAKDGTKLLMSSTPSPTPATPPLGVTPIGTPAVMPPPPAPRSPAPPFAGSRTVDFSKLTGQLLDNRYQVVKKVGEGGM